MARREANPQSGKHYAGGRLASCAEFCLFFELLSFSFSFATCLRIKIVFGFVAWNSNLFVGIAV